MKIDKRLRNLLMKQSETLMLSRTKCSYMDEVYEFDELTADEIEVWRLKIMKLIDKPSFWTTILKKLQL